MYKKIRKLITSPRGKYKFVIRDWAKLDLESCSRVLETKRFSQNLRPVEMKPEAKTVLVIAPHQDDDILGCGGTLLQLSDRKADIHILYLTDGPKEATLKVCKELRVKPYFFNFKKRMIPAADNRFLPLVHEIKPEIIFVPFLLDDHEDHRMTNQLLYALDVDVEIWAYQVYSTVIPNVVVDITDKAEMKRTLINMWEDPKRDWGHYMLGINAANCRYVATNRPAYVEAFFVVSIKEYIELCNLYFPRKLGGE